jgi:hypothetical protein
MKKMIVKHSFWAFFSLTLCLLLTAHQGHTSVQNQPPALVSLDELNWRYRVLLVDQAHIRDISILQQQKQNHKEALTLRQLLVILVTNKEYSYAMPADKVSQMLPKKMSLSSSMLHQRLADRHSILIGLDGGTKASYRIANSQLDWQRVFADIDAMPMRQSEIRQSR